MLSSSSSFIVMIAIVSNDDSVNITIVRCTNRLSNCIRYTIQYRNHNHIAVIPSNIINEYINVIAILLSMVYY